MKRLFSAAIAAVLLCVYASVASAATIEIGAAFGSFAPYLDSAVSMLIVVIVGWVLYLLKNKLNISIDDSMRDALQTWLQRQASSLVAAGAVKVSGLSVSVNSDALAGAANLAIHEIPDAAAHFGLTPGKLAAMIVDKVPHVPSVAATSAAQA